MKRYTMNEKLTWEERYCELEAHHVEETTLLAQQPSLKLFLTVLTEGREKTVEFFRANEIVFRDRDQGPRRGLMFECGSETWFAEFYDNGNFKQLVWA